ncbi:MAG: UbiH/UbiF family hydroxylase [Rhodocyclaceae bacterium]|nr:UbiH/UbiF family hydroxylase [Rhodocyclaceae bacterium]
MDADITIVGGGLAGLALAVALRNARLNVVLVEGRPPARSQNDADWDSRLYALSPANANFLESIGVWKHVPAERRCGVQAMEIYGDAGSELHFSAYDSGVSELAWIVESSLLQSELWLSAQRQANLNLLCPARPAKLAIGAETAVLTLEDGRSINSKLVVAADGADSWTRTAAGISVEFYPYDQLGVVANFSCEKPHRDTALQWFREDGVLAWLPLPENRISMVWSTGTEHAKGLLALSVDELARVVAEAGKFRLGELSLFGTPAGFPLRLMRAPKMVQPRFALIGDAAHTIHPLSGHGINLGFQDAAALARQLASKPEHIDCGNLRLLRAFERSRAEDVLALQTVTDALHHLFGAPQAPLKRLRNFGLNFTNQLPVIKDALVRYALVS